jgi:L-asparaginase II
MADPIRVLVRRGPFEESWHDVHVVAVRDGEIVEAAGDPALPCSLRSAAKPFQALPLARVRGDLDDAEIAIASASHNAEPAQLEAARSLLEKAGATEEQLACGFDTRNGGRGLVHNCSGKHAGMLLVCRERGWPLDGYHRADHPLQQELHWEVAAAADLSPEDIETGVDGCGVVCYSLPLERAALMFARLEQLEGGRRIADAMRARPEIVGGRDAVDTDLMRALPGWIAKRGAEAAFGAASPDGLGIAVKVADGGYRAGRPALAAFLARLGYDVADFGLVPVRNSRDELVGELVAKR